MSKIIALHGKKQSGKNTSCNFLSALLLTAFGQIEEFTLNDNGEIEIGNSVVNINDIDPSLVKIYAFADPLKRFCVDVFGLPEASVYGTNEDKEKKTNIRWRSIPGVITNKVLYNWLTKTLDRKVHLDSSFYDDAFHNTLIYKDDDFLSGRELMQFFGTDIVRRIYDPAWREACLNIIKKDNPMYAFICDMRFRDEYNEVKRNDGYCIKLTRDKFPSETKHVSEVDMDSLPDKAWDLIVDNQEYTMEEFKYNLVNQINKTEILKPEAT